MNNTYIIKNCILFVLITLLKPKIKLLYVKILIALLYLLALKYTYLTESKEYNMIQILHIRIKMNFTA